MSSLDFDLDTQMISLEFEWRQGYEASIVARAEFRRSRPTCKANAAVLDAARERLDRAEALKARTMAKIERLEARLLGAD